MVTIMTCGVIKFSLFFRSKKPLNHVMVEPEHNSTAQHRRDSEAYVTWKRKNTIACITLLSSMDDAVMCEFE